VLVLDDACVGDEPRAIFSVEAFRKPVHSLRSKPESSGYQKKPAPKSSAPKSSAGACEVVDSHAEDMSCWDAINDFITGPDPSQPISKDQFYMKLEQTPQDKLPTVERIVTVTIRDHQPLILPCNPPITTTPTESSDEFLVVACLGGGGARSMAVEANNHAFKFIPWGGVAACLSRNGNSSDQTANGAIRSGKAFCFLPLPVETQLPIHVNGYFELSSNRRDIWYLFLYTFFLSC
jgi:hypothetical protein